MNTQLRPALVLFLALSVLTGLVYPLAVTGIAQVAFPSSANGSLISQGGKVVGSELIGQAFSDPKHFWSRPSATSPMPYNAANSAGSNQGPLNPALADAVKARIAALRAADPGNDQPGAGGPGHRLGQRAGPAHQPRRGRLPGRARGPRARHAGSRRCAR